MSYVGTVMLSIITKHATNNISKSIKCFCHFYVIYMLLFVYSVCTGVYVGVCVYAVYCVMVWFEKIVSCGIKWIIIQENTTNSSKYNWV